MRDDLVDLDGRGRKVRSRESNLADTIYGASVSFVPVNNEVLLFSTRL